MTFVICFLLVARQLHGCHINMMADDHRERLKGLNSKLRLSKQDEVETVGDENAPCADSKSVDRTLVPEGTFYCRFFVLINI